MIRGVVWLFEHFVLLYVFVLCLVQVGFGHSDCPGAEFVDSQSVNSLAIFTDSAFSPDKRIPCGFCSSSGRCGCGFQMAGRSTGSAMCKPLVACPALVLLAGLARIAFV